MDSVQPRRDSIQAMPVNAQSRIKSSRSEKFLRYQVLTPRIEQADNSNHQPSGMLWATASPSLRCRLKSRFSVILGAALYCRFDARTYCARQSRQCPGSFFSYFWNWNTRSHLPAYGVIVFVWNHSFGRILSYISSRMGNALARFFWSPWSWSCMGCK